MVPGFAKGADMGIRSRTRRDNRRRQRERARARRRALLAKARPHCQACDGILIQEEGFTDVWRCNECGLSYLKVGAEWLVQIETFPTLRKAA